MKKTNRSHVRQTGKSVRVFKSGANLGSARLRAIPFALAIAFGSTSSFADPAGGAVAAGQASISAMSGVTTIHQISDRAVVNWQSFNVNAGEAVKFIQPSSTAAILNRVTGGSVSNINGLVEGNGRVYLINPNGIVVGANGVVNVNGGFVASTKSLADSAFMSGGALVFTGESAGSIQILGKVQSAQGDVILIAPKIAIEKTGSLIAGQTIKLVAANEVELSNGKFTVKPKAGDAGQLTIEGALEAAKVQLAANNNNLGALAINTTGTIRATGTQTNPDGSVSIIATGEGGNINISGNIRSEKGDGNGGAVTVLADNAIRVSGVIDANSPDATKKGGDIIIGRDPITSKLAKATDVSGATLLSNKGFVETSGDYLATDSIKVKAAQWLLDPSDITISSTNDSLITGSPGSITPSGGTGTTSNVKVDTIQNAINGGTNVTIQTTNVGNVTGAGNITIANALAFKNTGATDATLSLIADNGIIQNAGATITTDLVNSTKLVHISMEAKGNYQGNTLANANSKGITLNSSITTNGTIYLKGTTSSANVGITVAAASIIQGASVIMVGNSATGSAIAGTGKVKATAGNVSITGVGNNAGGYAISTNNTIDATGDIEIKTTSAAKHGIALGGAVTSTAGGVTIYSDVLTAGSGSALNGAFVIKAKNDISITGKTNSYYSVNGLGAIESTDGKVTIDATSTASRALNLTNTVKAKGDVLLIGAGGNDHGVNIGALITSTTGLVTVQGTSTGGAGVVFNGTGAGITANSYNVQGTSTNSYGVNFASTSTFNSSADSKIEGKNSSGGTSIYAANWPNAININSGAGKVVVRNQAGSSGGMELRSGVSINTTGDVTFGRNDQANNSLWLQNVTATATGGKLTFLGSSSSKDGIAFQDFGGGAVNINGINGAQILIDGKSSANGYSGVNMNLIGGVVHNVTSSGTGGSITINGTSTLGKGVNVDIAKITSNNGNAINITGTGGGAGDGVYIANAVMTANSGGNINVTGTALGSGAGVNIKTIGGAGAITANGPAAGKVTVIGHANTGSGINNSATITGGTVEMTGDAKGTNTTVYSSGAITSTVAGVSIKGTNTNNTTNGGGGATLQGTVTAQGDVNLEGYANNIGANQGLVIQNAVESKAGDITVTGQTNAASQRAVAITANGAINGSLKVANGKTININANTLLINAGSTVNAGANGTVNIKTLTSGNEIQIGGLISNDVLNNTLASQTLGIDNNELSRIYAGNLVIGDTASAGKITVAGATSTASTTGNITLQTGGNIAIDQALTVVDNSKTLTLKAGGTITDNDTTGVIKASKLELLGNAAVTLDSKLHEVGTLAADVKSLTFTNKTALTVGAVNTINSANPATGTVGINATQDIKVTTQTGNLVVSGKIGTTAGTATAILLNAGESKSAGNISDGNIIVSGGSVSVGAGGTAQLMTGSISGSTSAAGLASSGHFRYNSDETTTNYTQALSAGVNVIYREKPIVALKVDDVIKLYNGLAFNGGSVSKFSGSSLGQNGDSAFAIGGNAKFSGSAQGAINVSATPYVISATETDTGKSALGYDVTYENGSLMITYSGVNKAPTPPETYTRIAGDVVNLAPVSFAVGVSAATAAGDEADPNICYAWGQRDGGSVIVHTLLKPSYLGLRHAKTDTQEAMGNGGASSAHSANPCGHDVATNLAQSNNI